MRSALSAVFWTAFLALFRPEIVLCQYYAGGAYPSETRLFGVTYSPFALNQQTMCLTTWEVERDMEIIRGIADHVRIYSLTTCPSLTEAIMRYAQNSGIRVILTAYLSGDAQANEVEVAAVGPLVRSYGGIIDAVLVGNEILFQQTMSLDDLLYYVSFARRLVRDAGYSIPISTADVWPVYESAIGQRLVDGTDFICMNMQPFWEGWEIVCPTGIDYECASAGNYVHLKAEGLESYFGKPVWVCESGWPTEGERCCEGRPNARDGLLAGPSEGNATIFINELVFQGRAANRPTYVHAIFDEDWKRIWAPCGTCEGLSTQVEDPTCSTCELDYHFGIYDFERRPKRDLYLPGPPTTVQAERREAQNRQGAVSSRRFFPV